MSPRQQFTPPTWQANAFHCPHCGVYSDQKSSVIRGDFAPYAGNNEQIDIYKIKRCAHCANYSFWRDEQDLVYPVNAAGVPDPNPDLGDAKVDYEEAAQIVNASPRGAAALLRLCLEKICGTILGEDAKGDLNAQIGTLVEQGLNPSIRKSLDIVRVTGNEAVHPGVMDLKDDVETAMALFGLVNLIADVMISQVKEIDRLYDAIPESKRQGIEQRDG